VSPREREREGDRESERVREGERESERLPFQRGRDGERERWREGDVDDSLDVGIKSVPAQNKFLAIEILLRLFLNILN